MSHPFIISIEGSIGAGKTTLIDQLRTIYAADPSVLFLYEPIDVWTASLDGGESILARFYKDQEEYAFALQTLVYVSVRNQLRTAIRDHPDCKLIICERSTHASKFVFAQMLVESGKLSPAKYDIYRTMCDNMDRIDGRAAQLDQVIFLHVEPETCLERIATRARPGEDSISLDYIMNCEEYYLQWLSAENAPPMTLVKSADAIAQMTDIITNYLA